MKNKRIFIITIMLITALFLTAGCSVTKNVKVKKVKEFTNTIKKSNGKIKELKFYFRRPALNADLVYEGQPDKREIDNLVKEFKKLVNIEFMQEIGNKYWSGSRPREFNLYIYVNEINQAGSYTYLITSRYNKECIVNEEIENIDGYKTWRIIDNTQ